MIIVLRYKTLIVLRPLLQKESRRSSMPVLYSTKPLRNATEHFDFGGIVCESRRGLRCLILEQMKRVTLVPEQRLPNYHIIAA